MQKLPYKLKKGCIIHHGQHNCFGFPLDQKSLFKRILCLQKWCILKTDKMQDALDAQWVENNSEGAYFHKIFIFTKYFSDFHNYIH